MIGSLLSLIRSAAILAIVDGSEQITRRPLEAIQADIASQSTRPARERAGEQR